jgi:hypothetical protein
VSVLAIKDLIEAYYFASANPPACWLRCTISRHLRIGIADHPAHRKAGCVAIRR